MRIILSLVITLIFPNIANGEESEAGACVPTLATAVGIVTTVISGDEKPVMVTPISLINVYPLETGAPVLWNSKIVTDARSTVHITLLDQSTLTVGPSSEILLDGFVFDPCKKIDVKNTLKGFARVVSGNKVIQNKPVKPGNGYAGFRG